MSVRAVSDPGCLLASTMGDFKRAALGAGGLTLCLILSAGCASSGALDIARDQFHQGNHPAALRTLAEADIERRNRLLLYLERGLIAQAAGEYEQSIEALESAGALIDELDYLSISDNSAMILVNDASSRYRGEYAEQLWVHTFQMMNFLLLGIPEGAAVEARRALKRFDAHADVLDTDIFTRALMALSFEAAEQQSSADVEWRRLAEDGHPRPDPLSSDMAELILFLETGTMPRKYSTHLLVSPTDQIAFPGYAPARVEVPTVSLQSGNPGEDMSADLDWSEPQGGPQSLQSWHTNLPEVARASLDKRGKSLLARQTARVIAKHQIGDAIAEQDALAGELTRLLLFALEHADTRSWQTLPASMTLVRVLLPAGSHELVLSVEPALGRSGNGGRYPLELVLGAGERRYLFLRPGISNALDGRNRQDVDGASGIDLRPTIDAAF